jgi:hypothetical protein
MHPAAQEILFVIEGSLTVEIEGQGTKVLKAGEIALMPAEVPHLVSFCRAKTIPKRPDVVAQRDASTDRTAFHFRSIVGGCIAENRTSLNARPGRHVCGSVACAPLISPMLPASNPKIHDRYMCLVLQSI